MKLKVITLAILLSLSPALALARPAAPPDPCRAELAVEIRGAIKATYGNNPELPNLRIKERPRDKRNVEIIADVIAQNYQIIAEPLDGAIDYSFVYTVKERQGTKTWRLCVSMVGPFAALFQLGKSDTIGRGKVERVITAQTAGEPERLLIRAVTDKNYKFLDLATLKCSSTVNMPNTVLNSGRSSVRFWQALFRDEVALPL